MNIVLEKVLERDIDNFNNYISEMHECMNTILSLYDLLNNINVLSMYNEIKHTSCSIEEFEKEYPRGIIVSYDKGVTYRCSTHQNEKIADKVFYPYVQPYQKGDNPITTLFIIKNNVLYKLEKKGSKYIKLIDNSLEKYNYLYQDKQFDKEARNPVNVKPEELLEILEDEE